MFVFERGNIEQTASTYDEPPPPDLPFLTPAYLRAFIVVLLCVVESREPSGMNMYRGVLQVEVYSGWCGLSKQQHTYYCSCNCYPSPRHHEGLNHKHKRGTRDLGLFKRKTVTICLGLQNASISVLLSVRTYYYCLYRAFLKCASRKASICYC